MGNVNEGHERDEALSSSSDSADDISESPSSFSFDEREDDGRRGVDLAKETGDFSVLSNTLDVGDSLDEIVAESTRIEQAIELELSQYCQIGGDVTTMVQEPGMTSLISNVSLPISESIVPSSFDLLEECSPFAEGDEVFHTPDLSGEPKEETNVAVVSQLQVLLGLNDSLAPLSKPVEDESVRGDQGVLAETEEGVIKSCIDVILPNMLSAGRTGERKSDQQQVNETNPAACLPHPVDDERSAEQSAEIHMPSALSILDSILGNHKPLSSNGEGFNEVQTPTAIADAADEIIAKFENAVFVLRSTKVSNSSLSARVAECDKCGHILYDASKGKVQPELPERWSIADKTDEKALEEALFLSTVETVVGSAANQLNPDIISKEVRYADEAGKNDGPLACPVSFSDAPGEVSGNLTKDTPLAAPSSDPATKPEGFTQSTESFQRELECEQLPSVASSSPREESINSLSVKGEFDAHSQDFDGHLQADIVPVTRTNDSKAVFSGVDAFVEDSPAVLASTSLVSTATRNVMAVESSTENDIEVPPEKTAALPLSSVVSESLIEKNENNIEKIALKEPPDVLSLSPRATPATLAKSPAVNESAAKEEACLPPKKDEQRIKAAEPPQHTPDRPNWAVAPVEPASASKPLAKSERRKPAARRGRKSGEVALKDGPPKPSTPSANQSPAATSTSTLQFPAKSFDVKASVSKSSSTKLPEAKTLEAKAPAATSADMKVPDANKAPKPILRLPDIGTYEKPETKPVKAKPAVSFGVVPLTAKTAIDEQSAPAKQTISSTGADSVTGSRSEAIAMSLPSASQVPATCQSTSSVEPTPARRGRSMSISAAQSSALPPNKRPASIVSSWRSGMALPVVPEGITRFKQLDDGRKSLSAAQSSVATVDVSAKDKIAAILAESCQSNLFKFEAPTAQGNMVGAASSAPCPAMIAIPKVHASFKRGEAQSPESPLAEGFQANEHPPFAWRHGVTHSSPPTVAHTSSRATAAVRKSEDKDSTKDGAAPMSKGKTKAAKTKSKAKAPQPPQGPATVNVGDDDLSLHAHQRGEPVKVNLPQRATPPESLRYQTPPRTARPAFFSDVSGPAPITPFPVPASTHQHNAAFQRLVTGFPAHSLKPEQAVNRDVHPQIFMPQRSEGIPTQVQHSIRVEQPPQLRHYEFVPRNHTTSHPIGHSHVFASSNPIRTVDSETEHPGQRPIQVPPTSHQAFAANPAIARQSDNPFLDSTSNFDGRAQSRDFSLYHQQLYQQRQAEIMRQSEGLRHRTSESSCAQSQVNVGHPFSESWNGSLRSRPGAHPDVPIYQTSSRPSAPPPNFAARAHGAPLAGQQRMATTFSLPTNQFPPYNQRG